MIPSSPFALVEMLPPSPVFVVTAVDTTDSLTTYNGANFLGLSLSDPKKARAIALAITGRANVVARSVASASVGGVSLSLVERIQNPANSSCCELWIGHVPTGATGDVSVTWSGTMLNCGVAIYAVYDLLSLTPFDTATATADLGSLAVDIPDMGIVLAVAGIVGQTATTVWTGVTENYDGAVESANNMYQSGGSYAATVAETNRAISFDITSVSGIIPAAVSASFR